MKRARVLSALGLAFALGTLAVPAQQAFAAGSEKTVTLEVHGMV